VGKGTTFEIYLPAALKSRAQTSAPKAKVIKGRGRILVVDDEVNILQLFRKIGQKIGYHMEVTQDGQAALNLYKMAYEQQSPFDLVIMDLVIPGSMGGERAVKLFKKFDPNVKVVVCSGYANNDVLANYQAYGFDNCLAKPFTLEDLSSVLNQVLQA
jgi:CheY-like chemotaxis protein